MTPWSETEIAALYAGVAAGKTAAALAAEIGRRERDVAAKAERLRIRWPATDADPAPTLSPDPLPASPPVVGPWTPEALAVLRAGAAAGRSGSAIVGDLAAIGVTISRNAVVGKASRLGIRLFGDVAARLRRPSDETRPAAPAPAPRVARTPMPQRRPPPTWSDADEQQLRDQAAAGRSAREIADALGTTRSAVIGKASRLMVRLVGPARTASRRPRVDPGQPASALAVLFLERRQGQCAVILDDAAPILERRVCGAPVSGSDFQFCAHHRLRFTVEPGRAA